MCVCMESDTKTRLHTICKGERERKSDKGRERGGGCCMYNYMHIIKAAVAYT